MLLNMYSSQIVMHTLELLYSQRSNSIIASTALYFHRNIHIIILREIKYNNTVFGTVFVATDTFCCNIIALNIIITVNSAVKLQPVVYINIVFRPKILSSHINLKSVTLLCLVSL